jgi:hypothetical protein
LRGRSRDRGCAGLRRVYLSIALVHGHKCRFLTQRGRLSHRRACGRPVLILAHGKRQWSVKVLGSLPRGRYRIVVRARDRKGNRESARVANVMGFRVR